MPCYDGGQGSPSAVARSAADDARKVEALLCGLMTVLEKSGALDYLLTRFDEKEAGRSVFELKAWWAEHKRRDENVRAWEAKREAERRNGKA